MAPPTLCPGEPVPPDKNIIRLLSAKRGFVSVPFANSIENQEVLNQYSLHSNGVYCPNYQPHPGFMQTQRNQDYNIRVYTNHNFFLCHRENETTVAYGGFRPVKCQE